MIRTYIPVEAEAFSIPFCVRVNQPEMPLYSARSLKPRAQTQLRLLWPSGVAELAKHSVPVLRSHSRA